MEIVLPAGAGSPFAADLGEGPTGSQFRHGLPGWAREALDPLLAAWQRCGASERRMRAQPLPDSALRGILAAADRAGEVRPPTAHLLQE